MPLAIFPVGVFMEKKEKEEKKDNQHKLKNAIAITIGLKVYLQLSNGG